MSVATINPDWGSKPGMPLFLPCSSLPFKNKLWITSSLHEEPPTPAPSASLRDSRDVEPQQLARAWTLLGKKKVYFWEC